MDFITAPLIVFIVFAGIYGLFELFVRRRERLAIIEKMGDKLDASSLGGNRFSFLGGNRFSFGTLKVGCLLVGLGVGLLVGFFICNGFVAGYGSGDWHVDNIVALINGACVLIFGGIGLLTAFFLEKAYVKREGK